MAPVAPIRVTQRTATDIYNNAIQPMAVGLGTTSLTYQVQWGTAVSGSLVWTSWDSSSKLPTSYSSTSTPPGATGE